MGAAQEELARVGGGEHAAIEKEPLDMVGHAQAELGVGSTLLPETLGIAFVKGGPSRGVAGEIIIHIEQRMLAVMHEVAESFLPIAVAQAVEVVGNARAVAVTGEEAGQVVEDEVIDIQQHLISGVAGSVRMIALRFLVGGV